MILFRILPALLLLEIAELYLFVSTFFVFQNGLLYYMCVLAPKAGRVKWWRCKREKRKKLVVEDTGLDFRVNFLLKLNINLKHEHRTWLHKLEVKETIEITFISSPQSTKTGKLFLFFPQNQSQTKQSTKKLLELHWHCTV